MTPGLLDGMLNTSLQTTNTGMASQNRSVLSDTQTNGQLKPFPKDCVQFKLSQLEFFPWNNSDNIVSEHVEISARKIRVIALQILFLIGGPGNVINMAVFFKQGLRDRVNLLLFSLSLADELYLILGMVQYSEELFLQLSGAKKAGPVFVFIVNNRISGFHGLGAVSYVLSAVIAAERCYCVLRPLKYQTLLRTRTMACIIVALYIIGPGLFFIVTFKYNFVCVHDPDSGKVSYIASHSEMYAQHKDLIDSLDSIFFGQVFPCGAVTGVAIATVITTSKLRQTTTWRADASSSLSSTSSREVALTKMLIGTSVLFVTCVSPNGIFRFVSAMLSELNTGRRHQNVYLACMWITETFLYVNSSLNIFIYFAMGSKYRETFRGLFKREIKLKKTKI